MSNIRQKYNSIMKRIWSHKVYDYSYNFNQALINTTKLGLAPISGFEINSIEFSSEKRQELINVILHKIYTIENMNIEDLALKCFFMSIQLQKFLKDNFEINSVLTTGNVYVNKLQIHYEDYSVLKKRLKNKQFDDPIKFHSWLTLENLDVIDITFAPNVWIDLVMSGAELRREDYEKIAWIQTKEVDKSGAIYEPKILGKEYVERINAPIRVLIND
jgi:hypothetical protein